MDEPAATPPPFKRKNRVIQVKGNPEYELEPHKDSVVAKFNNFPVITLAEMDFPAGEIRLAYGLHKPANGFIKASGYGLVHIWKGHYAAYPSAEDAKTEILALLASVLQPGTAIYYEYGGSRKCAIFRSLIGNVIVEKRFDHAAKCDFYSVVTAIPAARGVQGRNIGTL